MTMEKSETEINVDEEAIAKNYDKEKNKRSITPPINENDTKYDEKKISDSTVKDNEIINENNLSVEANSPSRSSSPEPSCAICLEQLQNKSFADSCFHTFCFTCLVEWSKVKAECPLCKQRFKSIVYNVRSVDDYDQYHINSKKAPNWLLLSESRPPFRYSTTLTSERRNERTNALQSNLDSNYHQEIASHRMRYAPHSIRSLITNSPALNRRPCIYRQWVYNQGVWVKRLSRCRSRLATPVFYQTNPACTHRLVPWLNRELVVLLQTEEHVIFVMELIMALINRYEIRGREFFLHIEPYIGARTAHFIHEFYNFATSPYDMETYDMHVDYLAFQPETAQNSSDSDVIIISNNPQSEENLPRALTRKRLENSRRNHYKKLKKMLLKRNSSNNLWESSLHSVSPLSNNDVTCLLPNDRPSTSHVDEIESLIDRFKADAGASMRLFRQHLIQPSESINDDECMIVDVLKPKNERTPELIQLSSDEESHKVYEVLSGSESPSQKNTFSQKLDLTVGSENSSDIELLFVKENVVNVENEESTLSITPVPSITQDFSKSSEQLKASSMPSTSFSSLSAESEKSSFSESNPFQLLKTHETYLSTESYSDSENAAEKPPASKKLKLRSVIAHFSVDDLRHHSSHKKHKEKKKKKKKHSHKHKHRIYSDSD